MRLTIFNGSPRGRSSNTTMLLEAFLEGYASFDGNSHEVLYLIEPDELKRAVEVFPGAECVLLAFPLYVDTTPGHVKEFIEALQPYCGRQGNPGILYLVHSGFPEAVHSRVVERYLAKLALRLGSKHLGTIIKAGSEGIRSQPEQMTAKLMESLRVLGRGFGESRGLDPRQLKSVAGPEQFSGFGRLMAGLFIRASDLYWNGTLKKNGAFERRFARPYEPTSER